VIPIIWRQYTAKARGAVIKRVACDQCSSEYFYRMERTATGSGTSMYMLDNHGASSQATRSAERALKNALETGFDPVPCPACGAYQQFMIPAMRKEEWTWVMPINIILGLVGVGALVLSVYRTSQHLGRSTNASMSDMLTAWGAFAVICGSIIVLTVLKYLTVHDVDPNETDKDARLAIARSRAITREEVEAAQRNRQKVEPEALDVEQAE